MMKTESIRTVLLRLFSLPEKVEEIEEPRHLRTIYDSVNTLGKTIGEYQEEVRQRMFDIAVTRGTKDAKGSYTILLEDGTGFKKEARHRRTLNQERAVNLFREKGLGGFVKQEYTATPDVVQQALAVWAKMHPADCQVHDVVQEIDLQMAYAAEALTEEDIESVTDVKEIFAFRPLDPK